MENMEALKFIYNYGGLVIAFVLLLIATYFLPAKVRWYVMTAGITLIAYRAYQTYSANKKLAEADAERDKLRAKHQELEEMLKTLRKQNEDLRNEKSEIEATRLRLQEKSQAIDTSTDALLEEKNQLDEEVDTLLKNSETLEAERLKNLSAIDRAVELGRQFALNPN
ncbi:MAG: hypothetical protein MI976_03425 [Pseudomonadales bacterium]|nr:hypothetical protein [Pseudomonadales bacterium]